ncbi:MAG: hypothetical protein AB7O39_03120 [Flavobacteriaceae bacterium]
MTSYVDQITGNGETLAYKAPCRVATTASITLSGLQSIDGVTVVADDRVLVRSQTDASQNGIYIASTGVWQRARDMDSNRDLTKGTRVTVIEGSTLAGKEYYVASSNPISLGTDDITFTETLSSDAGSSAAAAAAAQTAAEAAQGAAETAEGNASDSEDAAAASALEAANSIAALRFTFSTTTTDSDPGAGTFRLNNADPASATGAYIDNADADGVTVSSILDEWDDSTSTTKGNLTIRSLSDATIRRVFNVTGSVVDGTGYRKLTLTYVGGAGTLTNGMSCALAFDRVGDKGNTGDDGVVQTVAAGTGISVDASDPANPIVTATVLDEDDMASDSATRAPSQQSVKAYVDDNAGGSVVATRTALKALSPAAGDLATLTEAGREGVFKFDSSDLSTEVAADTQEGIYVSPGDGSSGAWVRIYTGPVDVRWFGASAGAANNSTAFQAANDFLSAIYSSGEIIVPAGTFTFTSNFNISKQIRLAGQGYASHLTFTAASLVVSGIVEGEHVTHWSIANISVSRTGTAGTAVLFDGDGTGGSNEGAIRFDVQNLWITGSTGDGLTMRNTYIGSIFNPIIRGCAGTGIVIELDTVASTVSANNINIFGGEIQSCDIGMEVAGCQTIGLFGTAVEGNTSGGIDLQGNVRSFGHHFGYYEANGGYDVRVGSAATTGYSHSFYNCFFADSTAGKDYAIDAMRSSNLTVDTCYFNGYSVAGVRNNPATANSVLGVVRNCHSDGTIVSGEDRNFGRELKARQLTASGALDFASIADGDEAVLTITVTGAVAGDFCQVATAQNLQGMVINANCRTADTVDVTVSNNTGGAIDLPNTTYRVVVTPRTVWFA